MKHTTFIYGHNPYALKHFGRQDPPPPVRLEDLARIGIPARKAMRVMAELARISAADPALRGRATMLALAKAIARQLVRPLPTRANLCYNMPIAPHHRGGA